MFFPITVMAYFSIGGLFTTVIRISAKLEFFNYLCSLSRGLTSRFLNVLKSCADLWSHLTEVFRGHVYESLRQYDQQILLWEESIQIDEEGTISKNYHSCHKQSYPLLKSHEEF